jgi:NADH dehydrogenase
MLFGSIVADTEYKKTKDKLMKVVIVGGGFGGVKTALELAEDPTFDITLISERDHFLYYPALYGTATGGSHLESVVPLEQIFHGKKIKIVQASMQGLDIHRKIVATDRGEFQYDEVVLAIGVVTTYFGLEGLDRYSYSIKTYDELQRFKHHLHQELVDDKHLDKNYIIVGAGPTGVELSAALVRYLQHISAAHKVRKTKLRVRLIEAAPRVLPRMSETASALVHKRLTSLGVDVELNKKVESQDDDSIFISGKDVLTETVVWTSGVTNHPFFKEHGFPLAPNGRVVVDSSLHVYPNVFVIGDNAATPYTGLAQTALHDALFVAKYLKASAHHKTLPFYKDVKPPVVIPVGDNWAVLEWGHLRLTGWLASLVRSAADFIGYHDILPIGQALGVWHAQRVHEESCEICVAAVKKG